MSKYYRHLIEAGLLLDIYPNAAVAYSLRKLRNAYSGSAIRVRRIVDSAELDIGFNSSGDLDADAIVNFFGNNLLVQSENFTNASWSKTNSVITTGAILGPNGVDMADKLDENTTNGTHQITQASGTLTLGAVYFLSIYLRAGERNIVDVVSGIDNTSRVARLNLTTGTIVSTTFVNGGTLTSVGSGWYKFEVTVTSAVTSVPTGLQVRLTNGAIQSYVGTVGWGCYVWGAQISGYIGTPVPYFKTTTVRAADVRIVTFYDQSGNGNNSTQPTPNIQHLICQNGFITRNINNNKPIILLSAVAANFYTPISTIPTTSPHFSTSIYNYTGGNFASFGNRSVGGSPTVIYQSTTNLVYRFTNNGVDSLSVPYTTSGNQIITTSRVVNDIQLYGNNSLIGNRNTAFTGTTIPITNITQYVSGSQIVRGELFEMIFWNQDYTSLRSDITNKINEYYAIY
jgi:hypothetical protein